MHWPLAKIIRLNPGKDGKIRTVEPKTRTGTMLRPSQRVHPLEVQSTETPDDPLNARLVSRHGRVIKAPEKLDLFNQALYVFESK
ncbi:putative RNA-directed DNA polymerase from transposon X-element [Trichonephila clavipes]|nr:putative RNA-directed DNA polymerase from transposon X-element [Trichonephila clavipes]